MKTIVVSGITLRKGGTLTILREALAYLSDLAGCGEYRIVALVNRRELCDYPNVDYIEVPLKRWLGRLWYEYVTMYGISKELGPVWLWLSLHDVTPRVKATYQAVYCQTSFPFYKWKWRDFRFDPKIPVFAMLTRFYYRIGVHKNKYLIVQQQWLREGLGKMLGVDAAKIIVAPPERKTVCPAENNVERSRNAEGERKISKERGARYRFLYASTADCHKNFETLCKAAEMLEKEVGKGVFEVVMTVRGDENKYAQWLKKNWGHVASVDFHGLMDKATLYDNYKSADCLVFPSNIETWGLPISEYMESNGGPMVLSDLPYAHSTAAGSSCTAFFEQDNATDLKDKMLQALEGRYTDFSEIPEVPSLAMPMAKTWKELFDLLLE